MDSGSDSDGAPEELTAVQLRPLRDNNIMCSCRATREGKERRKRWAQRKASSKSEKRSQRKVEDEESKQNEESEETHTIPGMLPADVIEMLAAREKQTFESDSEEEYVKPKAQKRRKKLKTTGPEMILLKDVRATEQIKNAIDFLEHRKHLVPRSNAVLKNAHTAFRLMSKRNI
ncbi:hypothetical protein PR202_gb06450 [Eleusine coracana subsp. coracana]|uniref:Uncharacterized protein n=1 Tax=Eleusine coracana subsp. coracana TaxID=191504 RepID=A0AAV5E8W1_ELECO|nr:hypothetical protein PR202_gb06450 [Eleusine coracana subsp. coracana]